MSPMHLNGIPVSCDDRVLDSIFAGLDTSGSPGAAVGISIAGRPVYRKGFGLANVETPVPLSPNVRMRTGSISKHFVCLSFLLLCEEGKATLEEPVGKYLPELHPITHAVTIRQLMGHTSGLRDSTDLIMQFSGNEHDVSCADQLALYKQLDGVNSSPGTSWCYNNGAYLILSTIIERVTDQPLEEFLRGRIFDPLGMYDTALRRNDRVLLPNCALSHIPRADGAFEKTHLGIELVGNGGVVCTINDMLRWLAHMRDPRIGSPVTWERMRTPQRLANGSSTAYGLGLFLGNYRGVETLYHGGGVRGSNAQMLKVPQADLDVTVMVNRHDVLAMDLANRVLDACIPTLAPQTQMPNAPLVAGVYRSPTSGRVIQLLDQHAQQVASFDGFDLPMVWKSHDVLSPIAALSHFRYSIRLRGSASRPAALQLEDFGSFDELTRLEGASDSDARALSGTYRSDSGAIGAVIVCSSAGIHLNTYGQFGSARYRLEPLAEGIWRAMPIDWIRGGVLSFDAAGHAFTFSSQRTRALRFSRSR